MTGLEWITALVRLNGLGDAEAAAAAARALAQVELTDAAGKKIGAYSKGMRQRVKLAQALVHDPDVLILDEPFTGMDPLQRRQTIRAVKDWARHGKHVIVSSHILHEVEAMTSNILLINNGRIVAEGNVHQIRDLIDTHPHTVHVRAADPRALAHRLLADDGVMSLAFEPGALVVETRQPDAFYQTLTQLAASREAGAIAEVTSPDDNLQAVFKYLVRNDRSRSRAIPALAARRRPARLRPVVRRDVVVAAHHLHGAGRRRAGRARAGLQDRRVAGHAGAARERHPGGRLEHLRRDDLDALRPLHRARCSASSTARRCMADEVEDKTLTYLFTRPIPRGAVLLGKYLAYLVCTSLVVLPSVMLTYFLVVPFAEVGGTFRSLVLDLVILALGLAVYGAVFAFVGTWLKRPLVGRAGVRLRLGAGGDGAARVRAAVHRRALPPGPGAPRPAERQRAERPAELLPGPPPAPADLGGGAAGASWPSFLWLAMRMVARREYVLEQ